MVILVVWLAIMPFKRYYLKYATDFQIEGFVNFEMQSFLRVPYYPQWRNCCKFHRVHILCPDSIQMLPMPMEWNDKLHIHCTWLSLPLLILESFSGLRIASPSVWSSLTLPSRFNYPIVSYVELILFVQVTTQIFSCMIVQQVMEMPEISYHYLS